MRFAELPQTTGTATGDLLHQAISAPTTRLPVSYLQRSFQVDVRDYGAKGDGATDDTSAIQAAVDSTPAGYTIWFPPGTYVARNVVCSGKSGVTFSGVRGSSIVKFKEAGAGSSDCLFTWNPSVAPNVNDKDITIRNLVFQGTAPTLVSYLEREHQYLLQMSAVSAVLIEACDFLDFQGDAIYFGRTTVGGSDSGVHNQRVTVHDCYFHGGSTYYNRNAVSVIDGDNIAIRNCHFENCGAVAIDVEPNSWDTTAVLRAFTIADNVFVNNGSTGDVSLAVVPATAVGVKGWKVSGNRHLGCKGRTYTWKWSGHAAASTDAFMGIVVENCHSYAPDPANTGPAVVLEGVRGVTFDRCTFEGWAYAAIRVGFDATRKCRDIEVRNNLFVDCGGASAQYAIQANVFDGLRVSGNHVARTSGTQTAFIVMQTGPCDNAFVHDNTADGSTSAVVSYSGTTTTYVNNWSYNNKIGFTASVPDPNTYFGNIEKFGRQRPRVRTTTPYTMNQDDDLVVMNVAGVSACTLPDPTLVGVKRRYTIKNISASNCTVSSAGSSKTIDGAASVVLAQWGKLSVESDATQWLSV